MLKHFFMRKLLLLFIAVTGIVSCTYEDKTAHFAVEFLAVDSVEFPEMMSPGQSYDIKIYYTRPDDCHYYDGIYTEERTNGQMIAVQTLVIQDANCHEVNFDAPEYGIYTFNCPDTIGTSSGYTAYDFQIYKGTDSNGDPIVETVTIPVE